MRGEWEVHMEIEIEGLLLIPRKWVHLFMKLKKNSI